MLTDNVLMTFARDGFLSEEALHFAARQLEGFADIFGLAKECSRTAMQLAALLPALQGKKEVVAGTFFARAVAEFQGAVILCERGLSVESMVLGRSIIETVFAMAAVALDRISPEQLADNDFANRTKIGRSFLPVAKRFGRLDKTKKLEAFIAEHGTAESIAFERMANLAGLEDLYRLYRHLSHFAAHPSVTAASVHYVTAPDGTGHVSLRPDFRDLPKALTTACRAIIIACASFEHVVTTPAINARINENHLLVVELYDKYQPWAGEESE